LTKTAILLARAAADAYDCTQAASYFMPRHPKLQLVVVGPIGDATGAAAVCKLGKLAQNFSSRMYCPVDHYVAGEEKSLILKATDYCLVPSR
jgi:hypothetical protein